MISKVKIYDRKTTASVGHVMSNSQKRNKKTGYGLVENMFSLLLYKRLTFDHAFTSFMQKLECLREILTHRILCDIGIQTDHQISAEISKLVLIN